jgi:predicted branched-subunit amino acid permease
MDRADLRRGAVDVSPLLVGMAPFGAITGVAALETGLGFPETVALSVVVFAGASQLAALELLGVDAHLAVVVVTAVVVNLRMLMYSASIAPYFERFSAAWRAGLSYLLTDPSYALSIVEFRSGRDVDRRAYYLGVAVTLWVTWQLTTILGFVLGAGVPDGWQLDFAVPLVFLALLVPAVEDRTTLVAGGVGAAVAVVGGGLPLNLGLLVGAASGVLAGIALDDPEAEHAD